MKDYILSHDVHLLPSAYRWSQTYYEVDRGYVSRVMKRYTLLRCSSFQKLLIEHFEGVFSGQSCRKSNSQSAV